MRLGGGPRLPEHPRRQRTILVRRSKPAVALLLTLARQVVRRQTATLCVVIGIHFVLSTHGCLTRCASDAESQQRPDATIGLEQIAVLDHAHPGTGLLRARDELIGKVNPLLV